MNGQNIGDNVVFSGVESPKESNLIGFRSSPEFKAFFAAEAARLGQDQSKLLKACIKHGLKLAVKEFEEKARTKPGNIDAALKLLDENGTTPQT